VAYEVEGATVLPITEVPLIPVKGLAASCRTSPGVSMASRAAIEPDRRDRHQRQDQRDPAGGPGARCSASTAASIGTLGTGFYGALQSGRLTTPNPIAVQATLAT
jgi:UDP-N-acetylmuramoyl-L-alanyl-D-glutamate--2,6-diaminopimelate ligase